MEDGSQLFGQYELLRRLAKGGMAEVFLAVERGIEGVQRRVVVKRILPQHAESEEFVAMFMDEARVVARLVHPNIAHVYSFGQVDGVYYLAMEYVDGLTTSKLVKADPLRRLPVELALKVIADVCAGLHHAHELTDERDRPLHVIHRDVSPQNIMVARLGVTKLIDFGVARALTQAHSTGIGQVKGKLAYMAPEQLTGSGIDRRADIFAAGVVLHELVTGRRLFARANEGAVATAILQDEIPKVRRLGVPDGVDDVLAKALARDRGERYQTALEMQCAIEELMVARRMVVTTSALGALVTERLAALRAARSKEDDPAGSSLSSLPSAVAEVERAAGPAAPSPVAGPVPAEAAAAPDDRERDERPSEVPFVDIDLDSVFDAGSPPRSEPSAPASRATSHGTPAPASDVAGRRRGPAIYVAAAAAIAVVVGAGLSLPILLGGRPTDPASRAATTPPAGHPDPIAPPPSAPSPDATPPALTLPVEPALEAGVADGGGATAAPAVDAGAPAADAALTATPTKVADASAGGAAEPRPAAAKGPPAAPVDRGPPGTLFLGTRPWTKVRLGGRDLGNTPVLGASVPAGVHTVLLQDATGRQYRKRVVIQPGRPTKVYWELDR